LSAEEKARKDNGI